MRANARVVSHTSSVRSRRPSTLSALLAVQASIWSALILAACSDTAPPAATGRPPDGGSYYVDAGRDRDAEAGPAARSSSRRVRVSLDGVFVEGATVMQGGNPREWLTDSNGFAQVELDLSIEKVGEIALIASHPEARTRMEPDPSNGGPDTELQIDLKRFLLGDNEGYAFQDPGEPTRRENSSECAHCHLTITEAWFASPHRTAAKNLVVHDVYSGAAGALSTENDCVAAGGHWWTGLEPGTGAPKQRCYLGDSALAAMNPGCGSSGPCDGIASAFGGCADCHAD